MSDIADPSALPDTTTSCLAGVKEEGIHERKQAWSIISALVVALGSWSLSPLPILFGSKGLKASDTFTLQSKKWAGLSAEFPLSSCSANFHFLRVVIQRALASQMTHSIPTTLFYCLTLPFSKKMKQSLPLLPSVSISILFPSK